MTVIDKEESFNCLIHIFLFLVNCILTLNQYTKTPNLWDRDHENQHHEYFLCPSVFPVPFRIPYLQRGQMPTDLSPPTTDSVYLLRNTTRKHYLNFWHVFVYGHWDYYVTCILSYLHVNLYDTSPKLSLLLLLLAKTVTKITTIGIWICYLACQVFGWVGRGSDYTIRNWWAVF